MVVQMGQNPKSTILDGQTVCIKGKNIHSLFRIKRFMLGKIVYRIAAYFVTFLVINFPKNIHYLSLP